jgi:uncharacterized membrane protein YhaH (DUF805 family)
MEELFEFLFGASGRIGRAKYWCSVLIYIGAGLMTAVILFTAAGIAAPLLVVTVFVVLIPWLSWGASFTTRRLHDRDKSAWWLMLFYLVPGVLGQVANAAWLGGTAGTALHSVLALAGLRLRYGDSSRSAASVVPQDPTAMDPTRYCSHDSGAERHPKTKKCPAAARPPGGYSISDIV